MRKLILLLSMFSTLALGAGNDLFINQRNAADTGTLTRLVVKPAGTADGVFGYSGATQLPVFYNLGSGLTLTDGVLSATGGSTGALTWASVTGKPTFAPVATSGLYSDLTGAPTIPAAQVQTDWNATTGLGVLLNKPALFSGAYSALTGVPATFAPAAHTQAFSTITATPTSLGGYGITDGFARPTGTTAQYVRGDGTLAALPVQSVPTQSAATRALNTAFQVSAARPALVSYSVQLTVTASIGSGQLGDVVLEIASDAAFTTAVQTVAIAGVGQTYTLAVAIQGVQPQTGVVTGVVPAGYYARLRTVSTTGTPGFSVRAGQETLL